MGYEFSVITGIDIWDMIYHVVSMSLIHVINGQWQTAPEIEGMLRVAENNDYVQKCRRSGVSALLNSKSMKFREEHDELRIFGGAHVQRNAHHWFLQWYDLQETMVVQCCSDEHSEFPESELLWPKFREQT